MPVQCPQRLKLQSRARRCWSIISLTLQAASRRSLFSMSTVAISSVTFATRLRFVFFRQTTTPPSQNKLRAVQGCLQKEVSSPSPGVRVSWLCRQLYLGQLYLHRVTTNARAVLSSSAWKETPTRLHNIIYDVSNFNRCAARVYFGPVDNAIL